VKGSALASRVLWVDLGHGSAGMERLMAACGPALRADIERGINKARWYPFEHFVELNTVVDKVFGRGDRTLVRQLGRYGADATLTTIYRLFYKVGTVQWILGRAVRLWSAHYDSGYLEVATRGLRGAVLRVRGFSTPDKVHCLAVEGWAERSVELSGGKKVRVHESKCRTEGSDCCQFDVVWE